MSELLDVARRVADQAKPGEQVEAYVARSKQVSVRAYQGEVEALTSAESSGIGVRVIVDKRVGFAHAGTLDEGAITEALSEARDNAQFGEVDEWNGLAVPDGVEPPELDLYRPELASFPTDRKVEMALELERAVIGSDPRITGVRTSSYGDASGEAAIATSTGIAVTSRATSCWLTVHALASEDGEVQWGYGVDVGRTQDELDIGETAADAVERATRMLGAKQPKSQRLTVVLDPRVAASFLSIVGGTLTGERVLKGRSPFADRMGDAIASPMLTLVDDATNPESLGADSHDGEGLATRPNTLIDAGTLTTFLHNSYTARRASTVSTGSAVRGYSSRPGVGCLALDPLTGSDDRRGALRPDRRGAPRAGRHRAALGGERSERRLLGRRGGRDDPQRRARGAGARDDDRLDAAADAARHRRDRRRPRVASWWRRRSERRDR